MPYMMVGTCVHKKNDDGTPGEEIKCHETEAEAKKHMTALYANVKELRVSTDGENWQIVEIDGSLQDRVSRIRRAFEKAFYPQQPMGVVSPRVSTPWVRDIFDDHLIVEQDEFLFWADFKEETDKITFAPRADWKKVRLSYIKETEQETYVPEATHEMIADTLVSEFGGKIPSVPYAPGVDVQALLDGDNKPFFLTLPLSREGMVSKNGLVHDASLGESIVKQIMSDRPGGIMGHIPDEKRATAYPVNQIHWVGAAKVNGVTWGKGYVPVTMPEVREEYRILKAKRGKAATSIYGKAIKEFETDDKRKWRAKDFALEQIDLAPFPRAAAPGSGEFAITAEMLSGEPDLLSNDVPDKGGSMPDKSQLLAELTADDVKALPQLVRDTIIAEYKATAQNETRIAELTTDNQAKATRISELEADVQAKDLLISEFQTKQFNADLDAKIAELTAWNVTDDEGKATLESLRGVIKQMALVKLGTVREMNQAGETLNGLVTGDLKTLVEMTRDRLAGGPARIPAQDNHRDNGKNPHGLTLPTTPEEIASIKAEYGLGEG